MQEFKKNNIIQTLILMLNLIGMSFSLVMPEPVNAETVCSNSTVMVQWDPQPEMATRLYLRKDGEKYGDPITETDKGVSQTTIQLPSKQAAYYLAATHVDQLGCESDLSNEIELNLRAPSKPVLNVTITVNLQGRQ